MRLSQSASLGLMAAKAVAQIELVAGARDAVQILDSGKGLVKTASKKDIHFYVDPKLAERYKINLHLASEESDESDEGLIATAKKDSKGFQEQVVTFPSTTTREASYVCWITLQKPEGLHAVSAYMIDSYLGRYAMKKVYYFREGSLSQAGRCYKRIISAVNDLKAEAADSSVQQNEIPYRLDKMLQGESGEIEPKINNMATYLNPANAPRRDGDYSDNNIRIPKPSLRDELDI